MESLKYFLSRLLMGVGFLTLLTLANDALAFGQSLSKHCTDNASGLRNGSMWSATAGDYCHKPKKYTNGFKHIVVGNVPVSMDYGWNIHANQQDKVNAFSFSVEYTSSDITTPIDVKHLSKVAVRESGKHIVEILGSDADELLKQLHAKPLKIEKPTKLNPNTQFSRHRMNFKSTKSGTPCTIVLLKWTRLDNTETGALYTVYKTADFKPTTMMNYMFLAEVQVK